MEPQHEIFTALRLGPDVQPQQYVPSSCFSEGQRLNSERIATLPNEAIQLEALHACSEVVLSASSKIGKSYNDM